MTSSNEHPVVNAVRRVRRTAATLREMVTFTPACGAGFGALVGGLSAMSLLSQCGELSAVVDLFAPSWAVILAAEAVGAVVGWAKAQNRRAFRRLFREG